VAAVALLGVSGCAEEASPPPEPPSPPSGPALSPAPASLRRLLARQYHKSVEKLLGKSAAAVAAPPPDDELNGYPAIAAAQLALTDELVAAYEASARAIAAAAMGDADRIAELRGCEPEGPGDEACLGSFVDRFGRLAFRRPLADAERGDYLGLAKKAADKLGTFDAGVEHVIAAMLQSPHFLYQVEIGGPHPGGDPAKRALGGFELATRLSFFLLDHTPSPALLDAAEAGALADPAARRQWAADALEESEARDAVASFFEDYLALRELSSTMKDPALFPTFSPALADAMREETRRFVVSLVLERDAAFTELLTSKRTFANEVLAKHYGAKMPTFTQKGGWAEIQLPDGHRRSGVLGHASFLTRMAHATSTSATLRGRWVMERFLCTSMPPPPPDVVTELPPSSKAPTLRERLAVHLGSASCKACHQMADGIGLALENYDGIGAYRSEENGATIDAKVEVEGLGAFDGAKGLGALLAERPDVMGCVVRQLYRHATGHVEVHGELAALDALHASFEASGQSFRSLVLDLVASEAFSAVGAPP
jgi:hypothetical protein